MSKPAIDLVTRTDPGGHAIAWMCPKCRTVRDDRGFAERCCVCMDCGFFGVAEGAIASRCVACQDAWRTRDAVAHAARETARLAAAPTITEKEHGDAWVYVEGVGTHDGFFASIAELRAWYADEPSPLPTRAWACERRSVLLDAVEILRHADESYELHDGAIDDLGPDATRTLQALLNAWLATYATECGSWFPIETAVVLDVT